MGEKGSVHAGSCLEVMIEEALDEIAHPFDALRSMLHGCCSYEREQLLRILEHLHRHRSDPESIRSACLGAGAAQSAAAAG